MKKGWDEGDGKETVLTIRVRCDDAKGVGVVATVSSMSESGGNNERCGEVGEQQRVEREKVKETELQGSTPDSAFSICLGVKVLFCFASIYVYVLGTDHGCRHREPICSPAQIPRTINWLVAAMRSEWRCILILRCRLFQSLLHSKGALRFFAH